MDVNHSAVLPGDSVVDAVPAGERISVMGRKAAIVCTAPDGAYTLNVNLKPKLPVVPVHDEPTYLRHVFQATCPHHHMNFLLNKKYQVMEHDVLHLLWDKGGLSREIDIEIGAIAVTDTLTQAEAPVNDEVKQQGEVPAVMNKKQRTVEPQVCFCRTQRHGRRTRLPFQWNGQQCYIEPLASGSLALDVVTDQREVADRTVHDFFGTLYDILESRIPPAPPAKVCIYSSRIDSYGRPSWVERPSKSGRSLSTVYLPPSLKAKAVQAFKDFLAPDAEELHARCSRDYKLVAFADGAPGLGKTSFFMALCTEMQMNVAVLNVTPALTDTVFEQLVDALPSANGRVTALLLEDVECIFAPGASATEQPRPAATQTAGATQTAAAIPTAAAAHAAVGGLISGSKLLNTLDGAASKHGLIVLMSCNQHLQAFEERFRRRVTVFLNFQNPRREEKLAALQGLGPQWADEHEEFLNRSEAELQYSWTIADLANYVFPLLQRKAKSLMEDFDTEWKPLVDRTHAPTGSVVVDESSTKAKDEQKQQPSDGAGAAKQGSTTRKSDEEVLQEYLQLPRRPAPPVAVRGAFMRGGAARRGGGGAAQGKYGWSAASIASSGRAAAQLASTMAQQSSSASASSTGAGAVASPGSPMKASAAAASASLPRNPTSWSDLSKVLGSK